MALPSFLQQKGKKDGDKKSKKGDFRAKTLALLEQIKSYNEEKYKELNKTFNASYDSVNIQKKKILGFYAQLKGELRNLKLEAGEELFSTAKKTIQKEVKAAKKTVKKEVKAAKKTAKKVAKTAKKTAKKVAKTAKKTAKAATKKTAKKKTKKKA